MMTRRSRGSRRGTTRSSPHAASPPDSRRSGAASRDDAELKGSFENFDAYRRNARPFVEVKRSLFRAAIAVAADGAGALGEVPDPTDGMPFDLRASEGGFELTSRFALETKPRASLAIGRR